MSDDEYNSVPSPKRRRVEKLPDISSTSSQEATVKYSVVTERDVGITEYINKQYKRVFGIIKQRYSDFIVHEINPAGDIVHLTSFDLPELSQESFKDLCTLISKEDFERIQSIASSTDKSHHEEIEVKDCKATRTEIHKSIKGTFPNLDSRTIGQTIIRVFLRGSANNSQNFWNKQNGDYIKCVLYKENRDTSQVINLLAKMLRVKPKVFQYAGTKDKRAITTQHITVYRIYPEKLLTINNAELGVKLGNFEYCKLPLKLGDLKGNHFDIVLREICDSINEKGESHLDSDFDTRVNGIMSSLQERGFINYFGMQRFGTYSVPTHYIGRALLHSNWKEAIDLILQPKEGSDLQPIIEHYIQTSDTQETLKMFPSNKQNSIEYQLLKGLDKFGHKNLLAAFSFLPRNLRTMYVHSYQSYVWNKMVSFRFQLTEDFKPIPGDLVYKNVAENKDSIDMKSVEILTEDTCILYSIHDIVLPLPGYGITYPNNAVGKEYHRLLEQDGLTSDKFMHRVKEFALYGSYRHIIVKPDDIHWKFLQYNDVTVPLSQSDLSVMAGDSLPTGEPAGTKRALQVKFALPSSCYATMALRELLLYDTSSNSQTQLNFVISTTTSTDVQECLDNEMDDDEMCFI